VSLHSGPRRRVVRRADAAVAIAVLVAVACVAWSIAAARPRQEVLRRQTHAAPTRVSASGCPISVSCNPNGPIRPAVLALVRAAFGPLATVTSSAVVDRSSGRTYEETISARTADGVDVAVSTRCVIGGAGVPSTFPAAVPTIGPADLSAVVPGAAGCSAGVAVHAEAGAAVGHVWNHALALVRAPALQLSA
jgi:hypothetical protein